MATQTYDGSVMKPFRTMYRDQSSHWLTHAASDTEAEAWNVLVPHGAEKRVVRLVICDPPPALWEKDHFYHRKATDVDDTWECVYVFPVGSSKGTALLVKAGDSASMRLGADKRDFWEDVTSG